MTTGDGPMHAAELRRALGDQPHVGIPRSFRLDRAAMDGRIPVGAPGWTIALAHDALAVVTGIRRRRRRRGVAA